MISFQNYQIRDVRAALFPAKLLAQPETSECAVLKLKEKNISKEFEHPDLGLNLAGSNVSKVGKKRHAEVTATEG